MFRGFLLQDGLFQEHNVLFWNGHWFYQIFDLLIILFSVSFFVICLTSLSAFRFRRSKKNRILAGLWFGYEKPYMRTFLRPIVNTLKSLAIKGNNFSCFGFITIFWELNFAFFWNLAQHHIIKFLLNFSSVKNNGQIIYITAVIFSKIENCKIKFC